MARTVIVPPVTGVLIRALKEPDTFPASYSTVEFEGTLIRVLWWFGVPILIRDSRCLPI
jgi:hypothetical protein